MAFYFNNLMEYTQVFINTRACAISDSRSSQNKIAFKLLSFS